MNYEYYQNISVSESIAASMSVPLLYSPYPIKNPQTNNIEYYIDGDIRDTLSSHIAFDNQCETIINSWAYTPYHYNKMVGSLAHLGLPTIITQTINLMIEKKILSYQSNIKKAKNLIDTLHSYMKEESLEKKHIDDILSIVERKLNYQKTQSLLIFFLAQKTTKLS